MNCGILAMKKMMEYNNVFIPYKILKKDFVIYKDGIRLFDMEEVAKKYNFKSKSIKVDFSILQNQIKLPVIAFIYNSHYAVVLKIDFNYVYVWDETFGEQKFVHSLFCEIWYNPVFDGKKSGILFCLQI